MRKKGLALSEAEGVKKWFVYTENEGIIGKDKTPRSCNKNLKLRKKMDLSSAETKPLRFVTHSYGVVSIAKRYGWLPGARYTNLRDIKKFDKIGFLDIDWKNYDFKKHLIATKALRPLMTVAQDVENKNDINNILEQAEELSLYSKYVIIVPKDIRLATKLNMIIPKRFILGFSVPTRYGGTVIPPNVFKRPVHLLGGRPDVQRKLAEHMPVFSFDCNRFTLDATYGDYFDGKIFRPHPIGGYKQCIKDSIKNINALWKNYYSHRKVKNGTK